MKREILTALKTIIFMCLSTLILILLMSLIYYKFHIDDKKISIGVIIIYFVSNFIGGVIYGKIKEKNKFLYGIVIGGLYFAVLVAVSFTLKNNSEMIGSGILYAFLSCILGGMIGGMLG